MLRVPFMAAESDMDQLNVIFSALGTPTEQDWPVRFSIPLSSSRSGKASSEFPMRAQNAGFYETGFGRDL